MQKQRRKEKIEYAQFLMRLDSANGKKDKKIAKLKRKYHDLQHMYNVANAGRDREGREILVQKTKVQFLSLENENLKKRVTELEREKNNLFKQILQINQEKAALENVNENEKSKRMKLRSSFTTIRTYLEHDDTSKEVADALTNMRDGLMN